jgi:NADH dehydrogenase
MRIPLIALAQVRILEEGAVEALPFGDLPPTDLRPTIRFDADAIEAARPTDGGRFGWRDLRWCRA